MNWKSSKSQPEGVSNDEIKTTEIVRSKTDVDTLVEAGDALVRIRELVQCLDDTLLMYLIDMAILKAKLVSLLETVAAQRVP